MLESDYNINIYVKLAEFEQRLRAAEEAVEFVKQHKPAIIEKIGITSFQIDDDPEGYWTTSEILTRYRISRTCLYNYKKLVPLKHSGKIGKFIRYRKKDVKKFFLKITELKESNPELFYPKLRGWAKIPEL